MPFQFNIPDPVQTPDCGYDLDRCIPDEGSTHLDYVEMTSDVNTMVIQGQFKQQGETS